MHRLGQSPGDLERLLRAGARGDVTAFGRVYEAVAPTVYGLALRVLDDAHEAEDVTAEVLLEVWHTAARFDPAEGSPMSWVTVLAHRRTVDRARAAGAAARPGETAPARPAGTGVVGTAWQQLSADHRRALELAYFAGRTHSEIGRSCSLPLDAAKMRIRDGLLRLRLLLAPGPSA
jgi:RNA polymerase sigma-70 factor, ECF subfamily